MQFECWAKGEPSPDIIWLFNDQRLNPQSYRYSDSLSSNLTVRNVTLEDAGMYTCIAGNDHGTVNASSMLQVQGKHNKFLILF